MDGLVLPGQSLLVLGRPGSGCTTLLKTLGSCWKGLRISNPSALNHQGKLPSARDCTYTSEEDVHFPELTVRETLLIAARARRDHHVTLSHSPELGIESYVQRTIEAFKLSSCANTKVGNELIRGISGGERRRVTLAEAFIRGASNTCWDNSTRGMDSSTALDLIDLITSHAQETGSTAAVSAYQCSQSIYDCFTHVILLHEGREIYFGPIAQAEAYFYKLGFQRPSATTSTADYLTSLTHPREARGLIRRGFEEYVPRSAEEFADSWRSSHECLHLLKGVALYNFNYALKSKRNARFLSSSTIPLHQQVLLCMDRGIMRLRNNLQAPISNIIANGVLGLILGSLFYHLDATTNSFYGRGVLLFYATMLNGFMSGFEVITIWTQRPIVAKHKQLGFYKPVAEAISAMICDLPNKILSSVMFNTTIYFMANLRRTPQAFFTFLLFSFTCLLTMSMLFRTIGSVCRSFAQTFVPVGGLVFLCVIYSGFVIPTRYMHPWLRWFAYINPTAYAFESVMLNEFVGRAFPCADFVPSGPGYVNVDGLQRTCTAIGSVAGQSYVDGSRYVELAFSFHIANKWSNLGVLIVMMILLCVVHLLLAQYLALPVAKSGPIPSSHRTRAQNDEEKCFSDIQSSSCHIPTGLQKQTSTLSWENITYSIPTGKKEAKAILHGIDGWVRPGTLTALMGATGAGKTTLLDILANRTRTGIVGGGIFLDGDPRTSDLQRKTGYSQQTDIHLPTTTVREALEFSALLRQPEHVSKREKLAYADEVLHVLELEGCADAIVGVSGEGLNVDQRRRLTIGVELVAKPEVLLFLDEPTSGLDSQTAWSICTLLRRLANNGQTILCTIHQPSQSLLEMFDRLLLISSGDVVYFGDIGPEASNVTDYFKKYEAAPRRPDVNVAEWMFDITSDVESKKNWSDIWRSSDEYANVKLELDEIKNQNRVTRLNYNSRNNQYATSLLHQTLVLTRRTFLECWRTPAYLWGRTLFYLFVGLVIGFSFFRSPSTLQGLQNQLFAIFFLLSTFSVVMQQLIPNFASRRALFEAREWPSRTYSWIAFLASGLIVEVVLQTAMALLVFPSWYYAIGMQRNATGAEQQERGALMFLLIWSYLIFTSTLSFAVVAAIEVADAAVNLAQLLFLLMTIFCGILVPKTGIPRFWIFMYRVSPLTYLVSAMFSAGVANVPVTCSGIELLTLEPPNGTTCETYLSNYVSSTGAVLVNPDANASCKICPLGKTNEVLASFGIKYGERWMEFGLQWGYIVFNILVMGGLYWVARVRQRKTRTAHA